MHWMKGFSHASGNHIGCLLSLCTAFYMLYPYFMVNQGNTKAVHGQVNLQGVFAIRCDVTGLWATLSCTVVDLSASRRKEQSYNIL